MKLTRCILSAVIFAAMAGIAVAAEPTLEAARRCSTVTDIIARVTCYDHVFGTPAAAPVVAPTPTPAPASTAAVVAGTTAPAAIGDESLKKSSAERAASGAPTSADAKITAMRAIRPNVYRITLDNGQVWQQEESDFTFQPGVGDTVRIAKGAMGRFDMSRLANGKTGGWVRVTRVK
jgi:hypothetical protein